MRFVKPWTVRSLRPAGKKQNKTKLPWILLPFQFPFYAAGVPEVVKLKNQRCGGETRTCSLDHPQFSRLFLSFSYGCSFALILLIFLRQQILVFRFPVLLPLLAAWSQNKDSLLTITAASLILTEHLCKLLQFFELRELDTTAHDLLN